jgi:hypothetical protein
VLIGSPESRLGREQRGVVMDVDIDIARQAEVFLGNGASFVHNAT